MYKPLLAANVNSTEQVPRFDELPTGPPRVSRLAAAPARQLLTDANAVPWLQAHVCGHQHNLQIRSHVSKSRERLPVSRSRYS
jgi:hypothetical protein